MRNACSPARVVGVDLVDLGPDQLGPHGIVERVEGPTRLDLVEVVVDQQ